MGAVSGALQALVYLALAFGEGSALVKFGERLSNCGRDGN